MRITKNVYLFFALLVVTFVCSCATGKVPIGGVVDWYRPDASFPLPNGYMVADGSTVTDPESPLLNKTLPDLRSKFVRGAATIDEVGTVGGAVTHLHGVNLSNIETNEIFELPHWHTWAFFEIGSNKWTTWKFGGEQHQILVNWGDGIDEEGDGIWPLSVTENSLAGLSGTVHFYTSNQSGRTGHRHNIESPNNITTGNTPNEPPYVILLKIVRIK